MNIQYIKIPEEILNKSDLEQDYHIRLFPSLMGAKNDIEVYIEYLKYMVENQQINDSKIKSEIEHIKDIANAIKPRVQQFDIDFNEFFTEYNQSDILILKIAFFHYRNKIHLIDMIEDKKNPKNFEKPYMNALSKIKSIYEHIERENEEQEILKKAFEMILEDIEVLSITKRNIQREKNELIKSYLDELENKKLSHNKILEEFKTLNEILNS